MADLTKIKRRNSLGAPPSLDEASENLKAPEIAPVLTVQPSEPIHDAPLPNVQPVSTYLRLDGRALRKTGRTLQFATRVSWEFDDKLRRIAQRDGLLLVEVLERALDAYEQLATK